jgi:hypothetical protein
VTSLFKSEFARAPVPYDPKVVKKRINQRRGIRGARFARCSDIEGSGRTCVKIFLLADRSHALVLFALHLYCIG